MGVFKNKIEELLKNRNEAEFFKENSMSLYDDFKKGNGDVNIIPVSKMYKGGVYFLLYQDESNWMKYSPILAADIRDKRIIFGINFNFLPLDIRVDVFDNITTSMEDNNDQGKGTTPYNQITFEKAYKLLLRHGFEYAIVEYDISRIERVYEIEYDAVSYFVYSQYPSNIYDPIKLYSIWEAKLEKRPERHQEMIVKLVKDFYDVTDELIDSSEALKGHFQRLKRNFEKFGDKFS